MKKTIITTEQSRYYKNGIKISNFIITNLERNLNTKIVECNYTILNIYGCEKVIKSEGILSFSKFINGSIELGNFWFNGNRRDFLKIIYELHSKIYAES